MKIQMRFHYTDCQELFQQILDSVEQTSEKVLTGIFLLEVRSTW